MQNMQSKSFTMDEIYVKYSCFCIDRPIITLNDKKQIVEIDVDLKCETCKLGKAKMLIVGKVTLPVGKCPMPKCKCMKVTAQMPIEEFVKCIKS